MKRDCPECGGCGYVPEPGRAMDVQDCQACGVEGELRAEVAKLRAALDLCAADLAAMREVACQQARGNMRSIEETMRVEAEVYRWRHAVQRLALHLACASALCPENEPCPDRPEMDTEGCAACWREWALKEE